MAKFVKWDRPEGQGARKQMDVGSTPCCSATAGADLYACSNVSGSAQNVGGSSRLWWFLYRIGRWAECSAEAIPEHAVVDGTPNLQQQIGTSS
jgi:hypothetical protein